MAQTKFFMRSAIPKHHVPQKAAEYQEFPVVNFQ
jgi:hypothetical protein